MYKQEMQNKTRNMKTKIGLVFQKYYINQKSFAHLYFEMKFIFGFIKNLGRMWLVGFLRTIILLWTTNVGKT